MRLDLNVNLSVEFEEEQCCLDCRNYAIYMHALSETRARNAQLSCSSQMQISLVASNMISTDLVQLDDDNELDATSQTDLHQARCLSFTQTCLGD